jgi:hypothetical protein
VSRRILNHNNLYLWRWTVRPKHVMKYCPKKNVNDVALRAKILCQIQRFIQKVKTDWAQHLRRSTNDTISRLTGLSRLLVTLWFYRFATSCSI